MTQIRQFLLGTLKFLKILRIDYILEILSKIFHIFEIISSNFILANNVQEILTVYSEKGGSGASEYNCAIFCTRSEKFKRQAWEKIIVICNTFTSFPLNFHVGVDLLDYYTNFLFWARWNWVCKFCKNFKNQSFSI